MCYSAPMTGQPDKAELMETIVRLGQQIQDDTEMLYIAVADVRECQDAPTWQEIGALLSCSRQAAQERFTKSRLRMPAPTVHPGQLKLV